jgi:putative redox protein
MAIIANAEVKTCVEAWSGQVSSGRHQFITDKPASFGGQDKGPAPYDFICTGLILATCNTVSSSGRFNHGRRLSELWLLS